MSGFISAQPTVFVRDTVIQRSISSLIPIYASVGYSRGDSLTVTFRYNRFLLFLNEVTPLAQGVVVARLSEMAFAADSIIEVHAVCEFTDTSVVLTNPTPFIGLHIEPLAGLSDTTRITPLRLLRNNTRIDSVTYQSGKIRIAGNIPVTALDTEYISACAPNPTSEQIAFKYKTLSKSDVSFTFFNAGGKQVYRVDIPNKDAGVHEFKEKLNTIDFTSGLYSVRMQTPLGVYVQQFLMVK
ncbi:MAG: T9SS type A sorting domain-containing protein [Candidatus Kapabacteria bacterium]|nr:T9SS type A sorting domain-containing protein [Candidatus Kapabacteria bacterium]